MPRDGAPTRTRLLDAAERLVERNGFAATSVDAILDEAGSSKGAFFHHFSSKQDLARALLTRYVDADIGMLHEGLAAAAQVSDPVERVLTFMRFYETWADELVTEDSACLYIAVATERELLDAQNNAEIVRAVTAWREGFADLLRPALAARRDRSPAVDADDLADHLFATFEGAYLMCRTLGSPAPMRAQLGIFRRLLESLLAG